LAAGCGGDTEGGDAANGGNGGKADGEGESFPCEVVTESGAKVEMAQRKDVLAEKVLKTGSTCPKDYAEIIAKLRETDAEGCRVEDKRSGMSAMVVTERAQLLKSPQTYRVVVTRRCGGRAQEELFFSLFGVSKDPSSPLPPNVEVMAFDASTNQYNYYELTNGEWVFFGSSTDLIQPGAESRCAACHTGGGPIMKELDTPWVHWEGHEDIPGARELVDAHDDLGTKSSGSTMESLVKSGNRRWNKTRLELLKAQGDAKALLRPLFCPVELNIDNGADFRTSNLSSINADFLVDPHLKGFASVPVNEADYQALLVEFNQRMEDQRGPLKEGDAVLRDTVFRFPYIERAHADNDYVDKLKEAGILDDDLMFDVLVTDFTRPVFSQSRCDLLEFAPEGLTELTAQSLRDGFIAKLQGNGEGDAASAELLARLQDTADLQKNKDKVEAFFTACKARPQKDFLRDALQIAFHGRDKARELPVFENHEVLPVADHNITDDNRLNPETCVLE
jgi:hypothetical protein